VLRNELREVQKITYIQKPRSLYLSPLVVKMSNARAVIFRNFASFISAECIYTGCPRRNVSDFERVFLMLKYTDITQNTYVHS